MRSGGEEWWRQQLELRRSEFLRKRNSKEGVEWMQWQIMRLPVTFIGQRKEER
jgi:hypothetical protein